jgi:hypothetical protein
MLNVSIKTACSVDELSVVGDLVEVHESTGHKLLNGTVNATEGLTGSGTLGTEHTSKLGGGGHDHAESLLEAFAKIVPEVEVLELALLSLQHHELVSVDTIRELLGGIGTLLESISILTVLGIRASHVLEDGDTNISNLFGDSSSGGETLLEALGEVVPEVQLLELFVGQILEVHEHGLALGSVDTVGESLGGVSGLTSSSGVVRVLRVLANHVLEDGDTDLGDLLGNVGGSGEALLETFGEVVPEVEVLELGGVSSDDSEVSLSESHDCG